MTVKGDLTRKAEKELMQLDNTELRHQKEFSFPNTNNVSKAAHPCLCWRRFWRNPSLSEGLLGWRQDCSIMSACWVPCLWGRLVPGALAVVCLPYCTNLRVPALLNVTSAQQSASRHRCCPWRPWSYLHAGLPAEEVRQELGQAQGLGDDGLRLHCHAGVLADAWASCFGGSADAMRPGAGPCLPGNPALLCSAWQVQPSPATAWSTDGDLAAAVSDQLCHRS